jgi:hypothetical protein
VRVFRPASTTCQVEDETLPTITPHDLRHTAVSLAVSVGGNDKAIRRMVGHAKASMTLDTYVDLFDEDLDDVADCLNAAIRTTADALRTTAKGLMERPDLRKLVELRGIEPLTFSMRTRRATNCAIAPDR